MHHDDPAETNQVFKPEDLGIPLMWATHPSNFDREQNVKRRYLRSPLAEEPAWILFQDTAAVLSCLDLFVTSDTAVAHLAGALGVPVWMALSTTPDWRWLSGCRLDKREIAATIRLERGLTPPSCRSCLAHNRVGGFLAVPSSHTTEHTHRTWRFPAGCSAA